MKSEWPWERDEKNELFETLDAMNRARNITLATSISAMAQAITFLPSVVTYIMLQSSSTQEVEDNRWVRPLWKRPRLRMAAQLRTRGQAMQFVRGDNVATELAILYEKEPVAMASTTIRSVCADSFHHLYLQLPVPIKILIASRFLFWRRYELLTRPEGRVGLPWGRSMWWNHTHSSWIPSCLPRGPFSPTSFDTMGGRYYN